MDDVIINADKLTKEYDVGFENVRALDGVSFEVHRGELISVTGASGSGKSTLLHILGGVDTASRGIRRGRQTTRIKGIFTKIA